MKGSPSLADSALSPLVANYTVNCKIPTLKEFIFLYHPTIDNGLDDQGFQFFTVCFTLEMI